MKTKQQASAGTAPVAAPTLADDILRGAGQIGAFVGIEQRKAYYLLETGQIPATKEGRVWATTRSRLRRHYNESRYDAKTREVA